MSKYLTIRGLRPVWELRGISCFPLEIFKKSWKGICSLRFFGRPVSTLEELGKAEAPYCLLTTLHLADFISTSGFRQNPEDIYSRAESRRLPYPTGYMSAITGATQSLPMRVYKLGLVYQMAGVS